MKKYVGVDILTVKFKDKKEEIRELRKEVRRVRKLYLWALKWNDELLRRIANLTPKKEEPVDKHKSWVDDEQEAIDKLYEAEQNFVESVKKSEVKL